MALALINRPCVVVSRSGSGTLDAYGNETDSEVRTATVCEVQQKSRTEPAEEGELSAEQWVGFFPAGTAIDTGDVVEVDDLGTLEVTGAPGPRRNPRTALEQFVVATLKRTLGAEDTP